tara:strand:- start:10411 stop:11250 length:840 start_codon:yes stop_codon:yes gene_type:complete
MSLSLVSVILTCYNQENYIEDAISSVLSQSYTNLELIIINDGSTDNSASIINSFKDPRILILNQTNKGVIDSRNNGVKISKGDYFIPLDGDDYLDYTFIEKTLFEIEKNSNIGFVGSYSRLFYSNGDESIWRENKLEVSDFLISSRVVSTCLIRKECWKQVSGYDIMMASGYEDYEFFISILSKGWIAAKVPEVLFHYRKHNLKSRNDLAEQHSIDLRLKIYNKHKELFENNFRELYLKYNYEILKLRKEINSLRTSKSYKVGNKVVSVFNKLRDLFGG